MKPTGSVLIVDDNKDVLSALEVLLEDEFENLKTITNPNQIPFLLQSENFDAILLDMNFSSAVNTGNEGLFWLNEIKKKAPDTSVIMMTAYGAVDLAVNALKKGAVDFILKPWNNEKMLVTIKSAYSLRRSKAEINHLKQKESNLKQLINQKKNLIVGNSKALSKVLNLTRKVAKTDVTVLITGENGTGKELIARELHQVSDRKEEVFISVDMGTIAETLFESELFGHLKGAFTDAKEDRVGKFEAANGGTLFLDEIGNLSLQMQAKLLSVIQNREIVKVGSNKSIPVDIRLLCATNCNLNQMVTDGLFREDLLYRINTIHIEVPAVNFEELSGYPTGECSEIIRERINKARQIQLERFEKMKKIYCNAHMLSSQIRKFCKINEASKKLLKMGMTRLGLSARAYDRILKVSRTIADLANSEYISEVHIAEAIQYRTLDRQLWI